MKNRRWMGMLTALAVLLLSACGSKGQAESDRISEAGIESRIPEGDAVMEEDTVPEEDSTVAEDRVQDDNTAMTDQFSIEESSDTEEENNPVGSETSDEEKQLRLSILGDSISTYEEWIPEGNNVFYPQNGAVQDVSETWWKIVLDESGMALCANGSSSGSTCSGDPLASDAMVGCSNYRISQMTGPKGELPDIIIVYMGTNDVLVNVPLGSADATDQEEDDPTGSFSAAYRLILDKLVRDYPMAQIYCCTLLPIGDWGTDQPFVPFVNGQKLTSEDYSRQIQTIAESRGIPVIDLYHCGVDIDNMVRMTSDGVHPTPEGMRCIADEVLKCLSGSESGGD